MGYYTDKYGRCLLYSHTLKLWHQASSIVLSCPYYHGYYSPVAANIIPLNGTVRASITFGAIRLIMCRRLLMPVYRAGANSCVLGPTVSHLPSVAVGPVGEGASALHNLLFAKADVPASSSPAPLGVKVLGSGNCFLPFADIYPYWGNITSFPQPKQAVYGAPVRF